MSGDDVIMETLRERIAYHQGELDALQFKEAEHRIELDRYTGALTALVGRPEIPPKGTRSSSADRNGTVETMKRALHNANQPLTLPEIIERMYADGWETISKVPYNTARTAIGRMMEAGTVARSSAGAYRSATATEAILAFAGERER